MSDRTETWLILAGMLAGTCIAALVTASWFTGRDRPAPVSF